jgi:thymidylate kinase
MRHIILGVLEKFNEQGIGYAVLRNYEFLHSSEEPGFDVDLIIASHDLGKTRKIFQSLGFTKYPAQFSKKHQGYGKYLSDSQQKIGFDVQKGGIHWNDMPYLGEEVLERRVKKSNFYILSDEDALIMYICHSILGKRYFKEKYKEKIKELLETADLKYVEENISRIFNGKMMKEILSQVKYSDFTTLEKNARWYAAYYVLKKWKHAWTFFLLFFRWVEWLRIGHSYPLIVFMGPDGSGKSTNAERLVEVLKKNRRKVSLVYTGRGKGNVLPIKKLAGKFKKHEGKSFLKKLQPLVYTFAAPFYTLDLLIRYVVRIFPLRKQKKIVVTDRYGSDILLMNHVPLWVRRLLLWFFPKPTLSFYLYNDAETLYERRKQQSVKELNRQMKLFELLSRKFTSHKIRTTNFEKNARQIEEIVWMYFMKQRY